MTSPARASLLTPHPGRCRRNGTPTPGSMVRLGRWKLTASCHNGQPCPGYSQREKEKTTDEAQHAGLRCLQRRPSPSRYDLCSTLPKKEPMKNTVQHHPSRRQEAAQAAVRQPQGMQGIPVHPDHPRRHTRRRRPHHPRHRRRVAHAAADRAGRGDRQPLGRQHGKPGLNFPPGLPRLFLQVSGGAFRTGTGSKHLSPRPKNLRKRA